MTIRFHVLASGSSGNACVLDLGGFGVLIDFGLSPRQLAPRMRRCGITWEHIHAVLLTHPHSDHWQPATLTHLAELGLPIYCHSGHLEHLAPASNAIQSLADAKLIRHYRPGEPLKLHAACQCLPVELSHDGAMTCGFRFDGVAASVGYLADLGSWSQALAKRMQDVDLLALEFNHDVPMQLQSGRHPTLIRRVIGDHGHLSNEQAADLLTEIIRRSKAGRLRHLVQLHLSRQCNRPEMALDAAERALAKLGVAMSIFTAHQDQKGKTIDLSKGKSPRKLRIASAFVQATLAFGE